MHVPYTTFCKVRVFRAQQDLTWVLRDVVGYGVLYELNRVYLEASTLPF